MWQTLKFYMVYGSLAIAGLGLGYASLDYANNGAKMSMVKSQNHTVSRQGQLGITHSWILYK